MNGTWRLKPEVQEELQVHHQFFRLAPQDQDSRLLETLDERFSSFGQVWSVILVYFDVRLGRVVFACRLKKPWACPEDFDTSP